LLDRVFQNFVNEHGNFYSDKRPIHRSQSRLKHLQIDSMNPALMGYNVSSIPNLYLPSSLTAQAAHDAKTPATEHRATGENQEKDPSWWSQNLNPVRSWGIPEGKKYAEFYDAHNSALKENTIDWPKFPHHKTPTKTKTLCIRYQTVGQCNAKCFMAHVDPAQIESFLTSSFNTRFGSIYA
jgi:hypothetical protein